MNGEQGKADAEALTSAKIAAAFGKSIERPRSSPFYRLGMFLVALLVVLLPVAYVALIGLTVWGVWWHATTNVTIFEGKGRASGKLAIYLTPLVVGGILVLFMIKPLSARPPKRARPVSLDPGKEPLLFELVRRLCASVGAPMPRRIDVDLDVNASAAFRRGLLSFFGNDLLLTLGLPLAAGLSLRQFVGVLAHEFGHFAQGAGMRISYVVRRINRWFARVVYERDAWDEALLVWSKQLDIRIGFVLWIARFFVWLTRRVLWVLMLVAHAVSTFFLREMEFDADRYEIQIAGSDAFEQTAMRLPVLCRAQEEALGSLGEAWSERKLGDNLPELVVAQVDRIPPEELKAFLDGYFKAKGELFDTHPPDRLRIERARAEKAPGVFRLDGPARMVFQDFDAVARKASFEFYREALGGEVSASNLVPTAQLLRRHDAMIEDGKRMERYFQGFFDEQSPPFLPDDAAVPPEDVAAAVAELTAARERLGPLLVALRAEIEELGKLNERLTTLSHAEVLRRANLKFRAAEFGLKEGSATEVQFARKRANDRRAEIEARLRPVNELVARRLALAVRLYRVPAIATKAGEPVGEDALIMMLSALGGLRDALPRLQKLLDSFLTNQVLLANIEGNEENAALAGAIRGAVGRWHEGLLDLKKQLSSGIYPFDHAKGEVRLSEYAVGDVPPPDEIGGIIESIPQVAGRFHALLRRIIGRLVAIAERVEEAVATG